MEMLYKLDLKIGYFHVDQHHSIRLSSLFQLMQEAAIHQANQYEIGTNIMKDKGESWILNRVVMELTRYPKLNEAITIQTWATRLAHFKGFREFRILSEGELIGRASTLWLYINLSSKMFAKLPMEAVKAFPVRPDEVFVQGLDRLRLPKPGPGAPSTSVSLRYSDIDGNRHVNNAAYMDMLQPGLYHQKMDTRPNKVQIQFAKEISPDADFVNVRFESTDDQTCFGLGTGEETAAFGRIN
jgi:medium-chain acyl-[acyl-carrier-protein] hydrolase